MATPEATETPWVRASFAASAIAAVAGFCENSAISAPAESEMVARTRPARRSVP